MKRRWVCRVVTFGEPPRELLRLVELLDAIGWARLHRTDHSGLCFDLETPAGVSATKSWAEHAAALCERCGFNGVAAPEWPAGEPAPSDAAGWILYYKDTLPGAWIAEEPDGTLWAFSARDGGWPHRWLYKGHRRGLRQADPKSAIGTGWPGASE